MTTGSPRRISMLASEGHFADHLLPVWRALPVAARGAFGAANDEVATRLRARGIEPGRVQPGDAVLVASVGDLHRAEKVGTTKIAIMEHGAGQSYAGHHFSARSGSFAGGSARNGASLFLHPGPTPAALDRAKHPKARVEVVGSPFLDAVPKFVPPAGDPVVAFAWHFDSPVCAETRTAFGYYRAAMRTIAKTRPVLGHAHPRIAHSLSRWYAEQGIPFATVEQVLRDASVLVADNTSLLFLFAATGRPVVVVNRPSYRRDVNHGLRFWDAVGGPHGKGPARIGPMVDHEGQLEAAIARALADSPEDRAAREAALDLVFGYRTGAAKRAAKILRDWAG